MIFSSRFQKHLAAICLAVFAILIFAPEAKADLVCQTADTVQGKYIHLDAGGTSCRTSGSASDPGSTIGVYFDQGVVGFDPVWRNGTGLNEASVSCLSGLCMPTDVGGSYDQVWVCQGNCQMAYSFPGPAGQDTVRINYNQAAGSVDILATGPDYPDPPTPSATTLTLPQGDISQGQLVTLRASVTIGGVNATRGQVRFTSDSQEISTSAVSAGQAQITFYPSEGQRTLQAFYLPAVTSVASSQSSAKTLLISPAPRTNTSLSVSLSANAVLPGESIEVSAALSAAAARGTLHLLLDGAQVESTNLTDTSQTVWTLPAHEAGTHQLQVTYDGDEGHNPVSSSVKTIEVGRSDIAATLTVTPTETSLGDSISAVLKTASTTATGEVSFYLDGTIFAQVPLQNGTASASIEAPRQGRLALSAEYAGDADFAPWASAQGTEVAIGINQVTITLTPAAETTYPWDFYALNASLSPAPDDGTLTLYQNGEALSTKPVAGESTVLFEAIAAANGDRFHVAYSGGETSDPATSGMVSATITEPDYALTLSAEALTTRGDSPLTISVELTPSDLDGEVRIFDGGVEIHRAELTGGAISLSRSFSEGSHELYAAFTGPDGTQVQSNYMTITSEPTISKLFEERRNIVESAMANEVSRTASTRRRMMEKRMSDIRSRLRHGLPQASRSTTGGFALNIHRPGSTGSGHASGGVILPLGLLSFDTSIDASKSSGGASDSQAHGSIAIERMPTNDSLIGVSIGADISRADTTGSMPGKTDTIALSFSTYAAQRLSGTLVLDGYADLYGAQHRLDISDDALEVTGDWRSFGLSTGISISGEIAMGPRIHLEPTLGLHHSLTRQENAKLRAKSGTDSDEAMIEARYASTTAITFAPTLRMQATRALMFEAIPSAACAFDACEWGMRLGFDYTLPRGLGSFAGSVHRSWNDLVTTDRVEVSANIAF